LRVGLEAAGMSLKPPLVVDVVKDGGVIRVAGGAGAPMSGRRGAGRVWDLPSSEENWPRPGPGRRWRRGAHWASRAGAGDILPTLYPAVGDRS